jgi:hypothetical protein
MAGNHGLVAGEISSAKYQQTLQFPAFVATSRRFPR